MKIRSVHSLLMLLLLVSPLLAQVSEKEKPDKEAERKQEIERKTRVILDEVLTGAWSLKLPENRAFLMSSAAQALWPLDEKRARNAFWDAINSVNLLPGPPLLEVNAKPTPTEKDKAKQLYLRIFILRRSVVHRIAKQDPQFALEVVRATRQAPLDPRYTDYPLPDDQKFEEEIAAEATAQDPERALQIARESLTRGFSSELQNVLFRLNERDNDLALEFAGEIINKISAQEISHDYNVGRIAADLLIFSRTSSESWLPPNANALKLSDEQKRDLVERLVDAALAMTPASKFAASMIPDVMPEIEQFDPDRVGRVRAKITSLQQTWGPQRREMEKYHSLFRSGDAEEMIRVGKNLPDRERGMFFRQAVVIAAMRGKAESLREVINKEVDNESRRRDLLENLDREEIGWATQGGRLEDLQKLIARIRVKDVKARALAEMAVLLEKKGEHDEALKTLEEARGLVKTDVTDPTQSEALFAVVFAYALVEPSQGFTIVERVIDRANEQISRLLLVDKIISTGAVRKGEIKLEQPNLMPAEFIVFRYGQGIEALANANFDRTKNLADRFNRNELRLMAKLLIAQSLLRASASSAQPTKVEATPQN